MLTVIAAGAGKQRRTIMHRRPFFTFALLATAGFALSIGVEAVGQPKPKPKPMPVALKLKVKPIVASAKLKKALVGKKPFAEAKVKAALTYNAKGFPELQLAKSKRKVVLERVDVPEPTPDKALVTSALALDPQLKTYQPYITSPYLKFEKPKTLLLPDTVSHVSRQTTIKNQGGRGTCVAHAAMAGIESWYKWKNAATRDLSEQHAFEIFMAKENKKSCWDQGIQTWKAAGYLTTNRVCANWAYSQALPACDITIPATCTNTATHGHTSTQVILGTAFGGSGTQVAENTNYLESVLAAGNDIVFGVYVAGSDWSDAIVDSGIVDVQLVGGNPADPYAGHAMLMVGYNRPGNYFEMKNSWGADSGHSGYVHLSYEYVQTYGKYGYYIKGATAP
jgi:hypothetical protein